MTKISVSRKSCTGFTMIEVLAALVIFGLVAAGLTPIFINHLATNTRAEVRTGAMAAAQEKLDVMRLDNPQDMPTSGYSDFEDVEVDGRVFQVRIGYCTRDGFCPSNNTRHLLAEVYFDSHKVFDVETVYTKLR